MPTGDLVLGAMTMVAGAAGVSGYLATYGVRTQWLGPTAWHGRTDTASVALTFDDGPAGDTERMLDALADYGIRATFFMIGRRVEQQPHIARRIVSDGHEVGNHSYSHPIYLYRGPRETFRQLERTQHVIAAETGVRPIWSRPPCGVRSPAYFRATRMLGLRTVQWSVAGFDWKRRDAREIAAAVLSDVRPGSIVLLHDGATGGTRDRRETVAALPLLIDGLRARDLTCASLTDLLDPPSPQGTSLDA